VLISDVGLPDGTGWDLLTRLREEKLPHPGFAVAASGFGSPADREQSKAAGFRHHLLKPFSPDDLDRLLEEAARELVVA
jgi:two-component system CheB/CheR fusion protein